MRVLLVVPPLTGHVAPLRAVAAALGGQGHEVAWCGPQPATSALTGANLVYPAGRSEPFGVEHRPADLRGFAALRFLWQQYLVPLADAMAPGVRAAVERFAPDLVVTDQQALAGALAAKALGVPWVTSASTTTELGDPLRDLPKVAEWVRRLQRELCSRHGVTPSDLRFSPELILAFTTRELAGAPSDEFAGAVRYVGSVTPGSSTADIEDFAWGELDGRPLVVVTLGTANARSGIRFLAECRAALAAMPEVQGVVVDPTRTLRGDAVLVVPRIPQVELLRGTSVLVCHAGHNTVCESLAEGTPMVLAPIRDDQSMVAERVVTAGAGVRLRFDRAQAKQVGEAVATIRGNPDYTTAADRLRRAFASAGGAPSAVEHLKALARQRVNAAPAPKGGQPCTPTSTRR
jgi:MGT family glycosyltransferase